MISASLVKRGMQAMFENHGTMSFGARLAAWRCQATMPRLHEELVSRGVKDN